MPGRPGAPAHTPVPAHTPAPKVLAASPRGLAAAALLGALAKAARSFTLYDPSNAVVRGFLSDYQSKAAAATAEGALVLDLLPFQVLSGGEVVYQEDDRERSLSFRLFRDGLRQLTFEHGVPWEELLRLLEILAVRFTGVRQQEDDSVTLIRKAEFSKIAFRAVEGFVPEEDDPEPVERIAQLEADATAPPDFDMPFPSLPAPAPYELWPLPDASLAAVRAEERPESFGRLALGAAALLLREATRGAVSAGDACQYLVEARDFFMADGGVAALADLAELTGRQPPGPLRDELLRAMGDPRVLDVILASLGEGSALPPEAARLLPLVPAAGVLDLLVAEQPAPRKAALVKIVEARLPAEATAVIERLAGLDAGTAKALARSVAARSPARTVEVLLALLGHPDDGLRVAALEGLASAKGEVPAAKLVPLLSAPLEAIRIAAANVLERRGDAEAFQALQSALAGRAECSHAEADALARAIAKAHPAHAQALFGEWIAAKPGLLKRAFARPAREEVLRWAAVSGLGALPGAAAVAMIQEVARHADDPLKHHCAAVLARRRHEEQARHG